jgi:hypothetical protein
MEEAKKEFKELEKTHKLTPRQEVFCQEYVMCLIGTEAYLKAYPNVKYDTAKSNAYKLLTNTYILARIDELQEEMRKAIKVTPEFLVMKSMEVIMRAAKGEVSEYCTKNGQLVTGKELKVDNRAINDAIRNISAITGLNAQTIKAQAQIEAKATVEVSQADTIAEDLFGEHNK